MIASRASTCSIGSSKAVMGLTKVLWVECPCCGGTKSGPKKRTIGLAVSEARSGLRSIGSSIEDTHDAMEKSAGNRSNWSNVLSAMTNARIF